MIEFAIYFTFSCFGAAFLMNLWKIMTAKGVIDRILALDTIFINAIALLTLYGLTISSEVFFEAAMIMAMFGFVSTVAYARFILRGNIIE